MEQQKSLYEERFRSENFDPEDHPSRELPCKCGPGASPFPTVPNHWWYPHIAHRRRYRVLRLLSRKSIR
jgi:hypothetical protein